MSVHWTEAAAAQLQLAHDYLAQSSPASAQVMTERILARAETLNGQPFLGGEVPEYRDSAIREVFEHPYRILYRVNGQDVEVIAVVHAARLLPRTLPN